jgi:hypothetical protein
MNFALVSLISAILFTLLKMGLKYNSPVDPKTSIQDFALAFFASLLGQHGYSSYFEPKLQSKNPEVFTEKPNF